ncbi:hypothetical protein GGR52DRAFT_250894 [Hypoxylon sp. FL1284]|nr:hypothetical protein GGR52DRAFT_250894 [Hypoxylon sp. FL1284]
MTTLYDGTEGKEDAVDLIVVPGLGSHPYGSFKSPMDASENWLRNYFPKRRPNSRILVYGYNSSLVDRQGKESITQFSEGLLNAILSTREDNLVCCVPIPPSECNTKKLETAKRPVVLLGHSLGGLLIKQALVYAKRRPTPEHQTLLKACYGFLFFGVPNRGLRHEELIAISGYTPVGQLVDDLVVDADSEPKPFLKELGENFVALFENEQLNIVTFYESYKTPTAVFKNGKWSKGGETRLLVTEDSATLIDGRSKIGQKISLAADHSNLVKYHTEHDPIYQTVQPRLDRMIREALSAIRSTFSAVNGM